MDAVVQRILTENYKDVELLIYDTVHRFLDRYGACQGERRRQEAQELIAEANLLFLEAYQRYDDSKGNFPSWVRYFIYKQLLERCRRQCMRNKRLKQRDVDLEMAIHAKERSQFDLGDFFDELSDDARAIVKLTLGSYQEPPNHPWDVEHHYSHRWDVDFLASLADDLRTLVELASGRHNQELADRAVATGKGNEPHVFKKCLQQLLLSLGWRRKRIEKACAEIKLALSN